MSSFSHVSFPAEMEWIDVGIGKVTIKDSELQFILLRFPNRRLKHYLLLQLGIWVTENPRKWEFKHLGPYLGGGKARRVLLSLK